MAFTAVVDADQPYARINPNIYGHFTEHLGRCIYEGLWVGPDSDIPNTDGIRNDVVDALKRIKPPVIRWPGGCFADMYHWEDGVGPRDTRPRRINEHWGGVIETNAFGTHEFIRLCRLLDAEPYLCGNVGSGAVREMRDWLEYCNYGGDSTLARRRAENGSPEPFHVKYWGVGNENWGCGGNMTAEQYAWEVRRFATSLRDFGHDDIQRIVCGANGDDYVWTRRFMAELGGCLAGCSGRLGLAQGYAFHYYAGAHRSSTEYDENEWYSLLDSALRIEPMLLRHRATMDSFDPDRKVGLICDEWGTWHAGDGKIDPEDPNPPVLWQQNTMRDALVAALTLDVFNRRSDAMVMSNIAQTMNVLQAMGLTDGPRLILTPTYHVYEMYAPHQGADAVRLGLDESVVEYEFEGAAGTLPAVAGSASRSGDVLTVTLANTRVGESARVRFDVRGASAEMTSCRILGGNDIHAHNTFDEPEAVTPKETPPSEDGVDLPPASVAAVSFRLSGDAR